MLIVGCDYHPGSQQIAYVDSETGESQEQRLAHREEAEKFYRDLAAQGMKVCVGMEAGRFYAQPRSLSAIPAFHILVIWAILSPSNCITYT